MTPEVQAAFETAYGTWALVVITGVAVVVGGFAARSANETFRLEADPVLVLTQADDGPETAEPDYVVAGNPSLSEGIVLRTWSRNDDPLPVVEGPDFVDKRRRWSSIILAIHNAGRSPALDAQVPVDLSVGVIARPGSVPVGFEPDPETSQNEPRTGIQRGGGTIRIPAIAAQSTVR